MPFKVLKVGGTWHGNEHEKLECELNTLERELDAAGMIIINVSMTVSPGPDLRCVVHYVSKSKA